MNATFDTLNASKRLREAGVDEPAADAIVEFMLYATTFPDISGLATKADIADMATKTDLLALKAEISISEHRIRAELHDQLRVQGFALVGAMTAVVGLATAIIKLFP